MSFDDFDTIATIPPSQSVENSMNPSTVLFEHFTSKKWLHSLYFEPSINALFINQEGKNCPQKIIYFRPYQFVPGNKEHDADEEWEMDDEEDVIKEKKSAKN